MNYFPGYRNVVYLPRLGCCRLFTWDEEGKRISVDISYNPYLYIETAEKTGLISLFNTTLKKKVFPSGYDRYKYTKDSNIKRIYENINPEQQFLIDMFDKVNESDDMTKYRLKIGFVDIECPREDGFPSLEEADTVINVITIYDSLHNKFFVWGLGEYTGNTFDSTVEYKWCHTERELLTSFLAHMEKDYYDILSGWNSEYFDIPYIINRIKRLFGDEEIKRLSPTQNVYCRQIQGQYGKFVNKWYIQGVSCVDYLDAYKIFSPGTKESFKLNDIAQRELGEKKTDYGNISLYDLAEKDWNKFVEYNIQDVNLLKKLECKLQYLGLLRMLSYVGLVPFESGMGTISVITGAAVIEARKRGKIAPVFDTGFEKDSKYEGAFVAPPKQGFQKYIASFDVNSLYPNTMITLNLSPETKVGYWNKNSDGTTTFRHINGKTVTLPDEKFKKLVEIEKLSLTRAGVCFTQKTKGIFPEIVDNYYKKRVEIQNRSDTLSKEIYELEKSGKQPDKLAELKYKHEQLDIHQFTLKILINRTYGYFGNKYAPMGDSDIARSITLTGQAVIKQSNEILNSYVSKLINETCDVSIYNDTDSSYITLKPVVDKLKIEFIDSKTGNVSSGVHKIVNDIENHLNKEIYNWGVTELNSMDCRFIFKREAICDTAFFKEKKRYVLHVLDNKKIPCNKWKYVGVEVVRTTLPKPVKPYIKKIIETMITTQDIKKTNEVVFETYTIFKALDITDISFTSGISDYEKHATKCIDFKTNKGMPIHVKAAYFHNILLKKYGVDKQYEPIGTGDKVRYLYVQSPNKYGISSIGYKYYFPEEFKRDLKVDYELMFSKIVFSIVESFYEIAKWPITRPDRQVKSNLLDLFS